MTFRSWWIFPIISAVIWIATLLAMLIVWIREGSPKYGSMESNQQIAYISDIGASFLKPLFITGATITVILLDISFIADRFLRQRGLLAHNTTRNEKVLSGLGIFFAIAGALGIILLSIFDTKAYPRIHNAFLSIFIGGYIFSAIFTCAMFQRLGIRHRDVRGLRISFWIKLAFILLEIALAIAFGVLTRIGKKNIGAVVEWIIALTFTFWIISFALDLWPARNSVGPPKGGRGGHDFEGGLNGGGSSVEPLDAYGGGTVGTGTGRTTPTPNMAMIGSGYGSGSVGTTGANGYRSEPVGHHF